uniref:Uncharacterized protein n=1 Tax=Hyaloperonospora arabidopsidis (strain Emoy2) TaxID=559515 RepID=M4BWA5_HYAAE
MRQLDVEMNIDMDVFCPSAMLDADAFSSDSGDVLFGSGFYPAALTDDVQEDIEQMLFRSSANAAATSCCSYCGGERSDKSVATYFWVREEIARLWIWRRSWCNGVPPLHDHLHKVNIKYEYCVRTNTIFSQYSHNR